MGLQVAERVHASQHGEERTTHGSFNPIQLTKGPAQALFGQLAAQGGGKGSLIHKSFLSHFTRTGSEIAKGDFGVDVSAVTMSDSRKGFITLRAHEWYRGELSDPRLNAIQDADDFYAHIAKVTNNSVSVCVPRPRTHSLIFPTRRPHTHTPPHTHTYLFLPPPRVVVLSFSFCHMHLG